MTAFQHAEAFNLSSATGSAQTVFAWIKARLEARRQRKLEMAEIARLRQLSPYHLSDAGVDQSLLFSGVARIAAVHEGLLCPGTTGAPVNQRPYRW